MAEREDYSGDFDPDFRYEDLSKEALVRLVMEFALIAQLPDRSVFAAIGMRYGQQAVEELAIEEWRGASPIYAERIRCGPAGRCSMWNRGASGRCAACATRSRTGTFRIENRSRSGTRELADVADDRGGREFGDRILVAEHDHEDLGDQVGGRIG